VCYRVSHTMCESVVRNAHSVGRCVLEHPGVEVVLDPPATSYTAAVTENREQVEGESPPAPAPARSLTRCASLPCRTRKAWEDAARARPAQTRASSSFTRTTRHSWC